MVKFKRVDSPAQLLLFLVPTFPGARAGIGACVFCAGDGASKEIQLGQVSSSRGKNCVTLGALATEGVMQILKAVELPQDRSRSWYSWLGGVPSELNLLFHRLAAHTRHG